MIDSLILILLNEGTAERGLLSHVCHKYAEGREEEMEKAGTVSNMNPGAK